MSGSVHWNDAKLRAGLQTAERECVNLLGAHYVRAAQEKISVSAGGAGKRARAVRRTKGKLVGILYKEYSRDLKKGLTPERAMGRARATYEKYRHSKPGEPPRVITNFLRKNVVYKVLDRALPVARAGLFVNALYGYFLEVGFRVRTKNGTRRVAPRPWMLKTFQEQMGAFRSIAAKLGGTM